MVSLRKKKTPIKIINDPSHILTDESPFAVKEGYKALRTNVIYSLPGAESKCIGFTSPERAEGKSTNAINLGIAFSQIEKSTVLLDCDLRLPTIAAKLGLAPQPGLSDMIVGEASFSDVIQHVNSFLDVIPAGQIPRDPTGILSSSNLSRLISKLKEVYEYVLIDLPPVITVTDAAILTGSVDGYLLVVRHGATDYRAVGEMLRQLELAEAKVLGFIYNGAPVADKKYYYHYYYA